MMDLECTRGTESWQCEDASRHHAMCLGRNRRESWDSGEGGRRDRPWGTEESSSDQDAPLGPNSGKAPKQ